jgi:hypothetical protein
MPALLSSSRASSWLMVLSFDQQDARSSQGGAAAFGGLVAPLCVQRAAAWHLQQRLQARFEHRGRRHRLGQCRRCSELLVDQAVGHLIKAERGQHQHGRRWLAQPRPRVARHVEDVARLLVLDERLGEDLDGERKVADRRIETRARHRVRGTVAVVQVDRDVERRDAQVGQFVEVHVGHVLRWRRRRRHFDGGCDPCRCQQDRQRRGRPASRCPAKQWPDVEDRHPNLRSIDLACTAYPLHSRF